MWMEYFLIFKLLGVLTKAIVYCIFVLQVMLAF